MKKLAIPIRLKIMMSLLVALTLVVIVISFVMAHFFNNDKQSYMNDWVSIAAQSTAEEVRAVLDGYAERLHRYGDIMRADIDSDEKQRLVQGVFDDFPELIHAVIYRRGQPVESVVEGQALEEAGLTVAELKRQLAAEPVPLDDVPAEGVYIRNFSVSDRLASMTFAVRGRSGAEGSTAAADEVIAAEITLSELMRVGANFKVFEIVLVTPDGTLLAHPEAERVARREAGNLIPAAMNVDADYRAGMTMEFVRDGTEMIGGFAGVGVGGIVVAAQLPKSAANLASRELLRQLTLVATLLLLVVALGSRLWARRITRPVERLSEATRAIAKGEFDVQVDVTSRDEIGSLAGSFNQMAFELKRRETALEEAHQQLIQSEKMAAFGHFGAGIAHEVKNPLAGILGCAQLSLLEVQPGSALEENLQIIEKETARCKKIIENLMKFARQERTQLEPTDVNHVVEDAVAIVNHQLEMHKVQLQTMIDPAVPLISGNGNQLQQVLINLIINAQQAMEQTGGTVTISTGLLDSGQVRISVADTGPGIPEEIRGRLFDPFFTTKPTGKGTGLGLSVSYGIVQDHNGRIEVESEVGQGATFSITLPGLDPAVLNPVAAAIDARAQTAS